MTVFTKTLSKRNPGTSLKILVICQFFISVSLIINCCSGKNVNKDTLVIGVGGSLNMGNNTPVYLHRNSNVWETLTDMNDSLVPVPKLAESWNSENMGKEWTFHLRKGVVFHDGTRFDAGIMKKNIERFTKHPELDYYSVYTDLDSMIIQDEFTIKLVFKKGKTDLPFRQGHFFAGIFSPASFDSSGKIIKPIGCGPYIFEKSEIGAYDLIKAFPEYYGEKPKFGRVEFRIIPDPTVRIMSLLRGDIDMTGHMGGIPVNLLPLMRDKQNIKIDSLDVAITHYLLFNCSRPPFNNAENRRYFNSIINRSEMVSLILKGAGTPAEDFFVPRALKWNKQRFSINSGAVNKINAGNKTEPVSEKKWNIVFLLSQGDINAWGYKQIADYMADYFTKYGITVTVKSLEGGAWQDATKNGEYDITLYPLSIPTGTPDLFIRRLAYSEGMKIRNKGNTTHYSSKEVDSLLEKGLLSENIEIQGAIYNKILDILAMDMPVVPLFHEKYYYAYRKGLTGIRLDPFLKPAINFINDEGN